MKTIFYDDFKSFIQKQYPYSWGLENNCENPNKLGWVDNGEFHILHGGNKHFPLMPPAQDFLLEFRCRSDRFFSPLQLRIFFRYDRREQTGYCLNYKWGISGNRTQCGQTEEKTYSAQLCRYYGKRTQQQFEKIGETEIPGFCPDLSQPQDFRLEVSGNDCSFYHDGKKVADFHDLESMFVRAGFIAFDRMQYAKPAFRFSSITIKSDEAVEVHPVLPERKIEFPSSVNGIISPYYFHIAVAESAGRKILKTKLTGGPSKEPLPDIDRCRFNERMSDPYVRIESADGRDLGKFYIFKGTVGLGEFNWNTKTSVMLPADGECPIERDFILETLPEDARFLIGYENYFAEDSICLAGGPTEALVSAEGKVIYVGAPLTPGAVVMMTESPKDKKVCARIPKDIPDYEDALKFAENNFFFMAAENPRIGVTVMSRDKTITGKNILLKATLENVFKEPLRAPVKCPLKKMHCDIADADKFSSGFMKLDKLPVGVYHILFELFIDGMKSRELRRTFEVMADDPMSLSAPVASGLPKLYIDILSGIKNEHFYPWGHTATDTAHYNYGGNNFFKVAAERRCWELLHVYGRTWQCWLKSWKTVFKARGIDANADLIKVCDAVLDTLRRQDLWSPGNYRGDIIYNNLLDFLKSGEFEPLNDGCLSHDAVVGNQEKGITLAQFKELVAHHWKKWILFFAEEVTGRMLPEAVGKIKAINPDCKVFEYCTVYPTYGSVYKAGYFPFYFGKNLRAGLEKYLPGPNSFEDYPYSSGYAIARGVYQLASCKLEAPKLTFYPEMFGINGETLDDHVVYANPPYGQSDPPPGFFLKQFYEYSFGVCWFDVNGFNFWNDHGYYPKTWDRENYDEMLYAYSFISKVKPVKPLRTTAFVFSLASCMAHPDHYEQNEELFNNGYVFNTAEESVAFAYEQARADGQQAGFVVRMEDVGKLKPDEVDLLVLPPLCGVSGEELSAIRKLHEKGVSLLGFEDAAGLEDLFGVEDCGRETQVTEITACKEDIISSLHGMTEESDHTLCLCRYKAAYGSIVLLRGNEGVPVLVANRTRWGKTAFYTVPPTVVRRAKAHIATYGQESISVLINRATALVMRYLGNPLVETSSGKSIAFEDDKGATHIIVSEDAWPQPANPIFTTVTINLPHVKAEKITCDKDFSIAEITPEHVKIRLALREHESARICIRIS